MIRLDRVCTWIFIIGFALLIPSIYHVKFIDELCAALFAGIATADCVFNHNWRKYRLLWIIIAIVSFYAIYSLTVTRFNTAPYIGMDWIIQIKPYLPFIVMFAVNPRFTARDRQMMRIIALANATISVLVLCLGTEAITLVMFHPAYPGQVLLISAVMYMFFSTGSDGAITQKALCIIIAMLLFGLLSGRSKYYGEFILAIFFICIYRPGILRLKGKHLLIVSALLIAIIAAGYSKFEYYFITGTSDTFDPNVAESFARPALYAAAGLILIDFFPFGTGLASYATYASSANYSSLYAEYGLDKIWGLSPEMPDFICDAFYPSLAQFGIAGLILFIYFWVYIYRYIRILPRTDFSQYRYPFAAAVIIISFILIESIAATTLVQSTGVLSMMLLGSICACGHGILINKRHKELQYGTEQQ